MVYGINRRLDKVEAKINKLQDIAIETIQNETDRTKKKKKTPQGKNEQSSSEP